MKKIHVYFRTRPVKSKYLPGDRFFAGLIRLIFKRKKISGVKKVFINLCKGFEKLGVNYDINLPFDKINANEPVIVLGDGTYALEGYNKSNPIIAGIGLMTHPADWPNLLQQYPVEKYLQHSAWTKDIYIPFYGSQHCEVWPAGIDTERWQPKRDAIKQIDVLIYNKILWDKDATIKDLLCPLKDFLSKRNIKYREITYGTYNEAEYLKLLQQSKAMVFLCEHESQGFACCEALSVNVPIFAWDQGFWLDPNRFKWSTPMVKATSVPFFDHRCGAKFKDLSQFERHFDFFWTNVTAGKYNPRQYIVDNLTLEKSAQAMLHITNTVYGSE